MTKHDTFAGSTVRHGTASGWREHQQRDEQACPACIAAKAAYDKRWRAAPARARKSRLLARAQWRAHSLLAKAHPAEYRSLYEAEKQRLMEGDS